MIKGGIYASMFGKNEPPQLDDAESFIEFAYELKLDGIEFRSDVGFQSREPDYLREIKIKFRNKVCPSALWHRVDILSAAKKICAARSSVSAKTWTWRFFSERR